jgi:hypothetical protein
MVALPMNPSRVLSEIITTHQKVSFSAGISLYFRLLRIGTSIAFHMHHRIKEYFMKKIMPLLVLIVALSSSSVFATTYTFSTGNTNITTMSDTLNVYWNLSQSIKATEQITSATLTISALYNWEKSPSDIIYIHLLDSASSSNTITTSNDSDDTADFFKGQGDTLAKPNGGNYYPGSAGNLVITFDQNEIKDLTSYIKDSYFGFGFDPDCHWYDTGMTFTITTAPVPEPGAMMLLGFGMFGLAIYGKRRMNRDA